jgi:NAD-dependent SIR2 family protein deacetylase
MKYQELMEGLLGEGINPFREAEELWVQATKENNQREKNELIRKAKKIIVDVVMKSTGDEDDPEKGMDIIANLKKSSKNPLVSTTLNTMFDSLRHSVKIRTKT